MSWCRPVIRRPAVPKPALPQQIASALRTQILAGSSQPGDRLETEPALARRLGVSRTTLRSAIALLEHEGHVKRRHGAGTFVTARPVLRNDLGQNFSVTDMISAAGRRPGTAEIEADTVSAPADIAVQLQVEEGTPLSRLRRVRTADGRRVVDSTDWARADDLSADELKTIALGSIYAALARLGLGIQHGVARIEPAIAGRVLSGEALDHARDVTVRPPPGRLHRSRPPRPGIARSTTSRTCSSSPCTGEARARRRRVARE